MIHVVFDLHAYWHAGTGRGLGSMADAIVARSPGGLPYLPGRSVKGLLRRACVLAEHCGKLEPGRTETLFGTALAAATREGDAAIDNAFEEARFTTQPGALRFESGTLGAPWEAWGHAAPAADPHRDALFVRLANTAVREDGIVQQHTLRTIEVAVPLKLRARVECNAHDDGWVADLRLAAPLVRHLGAHRNRGLGRVSVSIEEG